jgi:hypothetical protein
MLSGRLKYIIKKKLSQPSAVVSSIQLIHRKLSAKHSSVVPLLAVPSSTTGCCQQYVVQPPGVVNNTYVSTTGCCQQYNHLLMSATCSLTTGYCQQYLAKRPTVVSSTYNNLLLAAIPSSTTSNCQQYLAEISAVVSNIQHIRRMLLEKSSSTTSSCQQYLAHSPAVVSKTLLNHELLSAVHTVYNTMQRSVTPT